MAITRRVALGASLLLAAPAIAHADELSDALKNLAKNALGSKTGGAVGANFTSDEAAQGLRAALKNGVGAAVTRVSKSDGYWGDGAIRVPLPRTLESARGALEPLHASGMLDDLHLRLNRGAEKAAPAAKKIFLDALSAMTIEDAIGIVRGPEDSATRYFQEKTTPTLMTAFRPTMTKALDGSGAFKVAGKIDQRLSALPFGVGGGTSVKDSLVEHGLDWGLKGIFHYIGVEEAAIRRDPVKRTSAILRKVFG